MTPTTLSRLAGALGAAGLVLAAAPAAAVVANVSPSPSFSSLVVFGDSLSDAAGGNAIPLPPNEGGLAIPGPYDNGRVSNGAVAAEQLGDLLGLSQAQQFHYAVAGARSGTTGNIPGVGTVTTGLLTQVGAFAQLGAHPAYDGGLFMVWAGANDLRDFLETATLVSDPTATFTSILGNLQFAVSTLYNGGARNFLLPNMPNLSLTPASQVLGMEAMVGASYITGQFNTAFATAVQGWAASLPGAHLYTYDAFTAHTQLFFSGSYANTSNGCLEPVTGAAQPQAACDLSFYVDDIHPTTAVHQVMAQGMAAAVPEPGAMLLMAAGAVALLGLQRRRQRAAA